MRSIQLILILALTLTIGCARPAPDKIADLPDFQLTERSGRSVSRDDLKGKVWIASFGFTKCAGPCPLITGNMARLQHELADKPDVRLVTFTVDPERDTPAVLKEYAARFSADPERWLFLTGDKQKVHELVEKGFLLGVGESKGTARTPGNEFLHSEKIVVIDRQGRIRGYFNGKEADKFPDLRRQVDSLLREQ